MIGPLSQRKKESAISPALNEEAGADFAFLLTADSSF